MLSAKQSEYLLNCNHRWNIKTGAVRSGKSWLDYAYVIPARLQATHDEGAILLLGNTQGTLERNVLEPMRKMWGDSLVGTIKTENAAMLFGKKCYCMGADNKKHIDRIRGMTIEYAYGDEVTTWNEGVFQMLKSRLSCEHSVFDGTANPDNPNHFFKQFLDSDADIYYQASTIYDNPFLPPTYVSELEKEYAGTIYYKRYILGEWTAATGQIYPMYESAILPTDFPDMRDKFTEYALSIDYGTKNAFSAGLWGKYQGTWYRFKEYYYSGRDTGVQKTDEDYGKDLDEFTEEVTSKLRFDQKLRTIVDPSAQSFITLLKKRGKYKVLQADNAVEDGIRETATALQGGRLKIYPICKDWKREAAGYTWDESQSKDSPLKINDHAMDETRYLVKTLHISKPKRPESDYSLYY